jgi:hypothetical protein
VSFSEVAISVSDSFARQVDYVKNLSATTTISDAISHFKATILHISELPIKVLDSAYKFFVQWVAPKFDSFDPREAIRAAVTTEADPNATGIDNHVIKIVDPAGNEYKIPVYLTEETRSSNSPLPELPLIELGLVNESAHPQDIGASTRKHEAYIDVHVYWQKSDNIAQNKFGKLISDEICYQIRTHQCGIVPHQYFMNVNSTGRVLTETYPRQVIYHRVMEVYVLWYD